MELPSVKYFLQIIDGGIQDGCLELKMPVSQLLLNLEKGCFRFYASIDSTGSVKLTSDNYYF